MYRVFCRIHARYINWDLLITKQGSRLCASHITSQCSLPSSSTSLGIWAIQMPRPVRACTQTLFDAGKTMVTSRTFIIALLILTPIWQYTMGGNNGTPPDSRYHRDYPGVLLSAATAEQLATRQTHARKELPPTPLCALPACRRVAERHLVTFGVCGGLTNQRLALIDGFMLAGLLGMSVALPQLNANGRQDAANGYAELQSQSVPFSTFYDAEATAAGLARLGVNVAPQSPDERNGDSGWMHWRVDGTDINKPLSWWQEQRQRQQELLASNDGHRHARADQRKIHLALGCAMNAIDKHDDAGLRELFWRINAAIVFAPRVLSAAEKIVTHLQRKSMRLGGGGHFTVLHLRIEEDWTEHCLRWEDPNAVPPRDNCDTNTDALDNVFQIEAVMPSHPVYVALELAPQNASSGESNSNYVAALRNLRGLRTLPQEFALLSKQIISPELASEPREFLAAVDYGIAQRAHRFIGNSVSTFSALLLMQRQQRVSSSPLSPSLSPSSPPPPLLSSLPPSLPSINDDFHYNGGNVPLAEILGEHPRHRRLKWVFTLNAQAGEQYNEMARVAVTSALSRTSLVPVCIFNGNPSTSSPMAAWLRQKNVRIIFHSPKWKRRILRAARAVAFLGHKDKLVSPLYGNPTMMIATHLRFDIPILGFVDQFVFYADVDVMFTRELLLAHFRPLPKYYAVGTEVFGGNPIVSIAQKNGKKPLRQSFGNAGIMLINVESMRRTHGAFLEWVFSEEHVRAGLDYGRYGPMDQGAYNMYYQGRFDVHTWAHFNWKPYWGNGSYARLIHFHGPKPRDYMLYRTKPRDYTLHRRGKQSPVGTLVPNTTLYDSFLLRCDRFADGCYQYVDLFYQMLHATP